MSSPDSAAEAPGGAICTPISEDGPGLAPKKGFARGREGERERRVSGLGFRRVSGLGFRRV